MLVLLFSDIQIWNFIFERSAIFQNDFFFKTADQAAFFVIDMASGFLDVGHRKDESVAYWFWQFIEQERLFVEIVFPTQRFHFSGFLQSVRSFGQGAFDCAFLYPIDIVFVVVDDFESAAVGAIILHMLMIFLMQFPPGFDPRYRLFLSFIAAVFLPNVADTILPIVGIHCLTHTIRPFVDGVIAIIV